MFAGRYNSGSKRPQNNIRCTQPMPRSKSPTKVSMGCSKKFGIYLKMVLLFTIVILMYKTVLILMQRHKLEAESEELPHVKKHINTQKVLQEFVHNMDYFRETYDIPEGSGFSSTFKKIELNESQRISQYVTWDYSVRNINQITYNFNATSEPLPFVPLPKEKRAPARKFGRVIIGYNASLELTNKNANLSDDVVISPADYLCKHKPSKLDSKTFVVLATTMYFINNTFVLNNTIKNWSRLRPFIQPVLYVTPTDNQPEAKYAIRHACSIGWDVYVAPESNRNNFPVLRSMMADIRAKYNVPMIGYANGDIIFDSSLPETLQFFYENQGKFLNKKHHLIVGRRKDIMLRPGTLLDKVDAVTNLGQHNLFHGTLGFDYFISTHDGFPWDTIPPFIIGRPVFDNWLVWSAIQRTGDILCIDATYSIVAVHQGVRGANNGWKHRPIDHYYNINMVDPFYVRHGNTDCISRKLTRLDNGNFQVKQAHIKPEGAQGCKAYLAVVVYEGSL